LGIPMELVMKHLILLALMTVVAAGPAVAQSACEAKAVGKDGKPLTGAAKASSVKKCKKDACEATAVGKDGKKLAGAAYSSHMKKCEAGA
jgi:hypothetical protein